MSNNDRSTLKHALKLAAGAIYLANDYIAQITDPCEQMDPYNRRAVRYAKSIRRRAGRVLGALYSGGDVDTALDKHEAALADFCEEMA